VLVIAPAGSLAAVEYRDGRSAAPHVFTDTTDEVVVRFDGAWTPASRRAFEEEHRLIPAAPFVESLRFGVYRAAGEATAVVSGMRVVSPGGGGSVRARVGLRASENARRVRAVPGQIIVQFRTDMTREAIDALCAARGARVAEWFRQPGFVRVDLVGVDDPLEVLDDWSALEPVVFAALDIVGFDDALFVPNDPLFPEEWALRNVAQLGGTPGADIDAVRAWNVTQGHPRVLLAILDTGVDLTHPDLAPNVLGRPPGEDWSFGSSDSTGAPVASGWHGTAVAALALARGSDAAGMTGVAPRCSLLPLRLDLAAGSYANRADAIHYAASWTSRAARVVINGSWKTDVDDPSIRFACENAVAAGCLVVFAAGNSGGAIEYPARYDGVVAVGMTTPCDTRVHGGDTLCDVETSGESNVGPELDVVAPGSLLVSADLVGAQGASTGDFVSGLSGTSFAAPIVSGIGALLWSADTTLTNAEVRALIEGTAADQVGDPAEDTVGWDPHYGHGRVDAFAALVASGVLPPSGTIDGTLHAGGVGIVGAEARLVGDWPLVPDTTSAQGAFRFDTTPAGSYGLRCIAPGIGPRWVRGIEMTEGATETFDVDLRAGFDDDLEFGVGNWSHERGTTGTFDQWHLDDDRNHTEGGRWAWKCGSTIQGGVYTQPNHSVLRMPAISVQPGQFFRFFHWMDATVIDGVTARHGGRVELSLDGGSSWQMIEPVGGYPFTTPLGDGGPFGSQAPLFSGSHDWREVAFALDPYAGLTVHLRFVFVATPPGVAREGWCLDDVRVEGEAVVSVAGPSEVPHAPVLRLAAAPNPVAAHATISFVLEREAHVRLTAVDATGRLVRTLADAALEGGAHAVSWDGRDRRGRPVPSGVYYVVLEAGAQRGAQAIHVVR